MDRKRECERDARDGVRGGWRLWVISRISAFVGWVAVGVAVWHICRKTHTYIQGDTSHHDGYVSSCCRGDWKQYRDMTGTHGSHTCKNNPFPWHTQAQSLFKTLRMKTGMEGYILSIRGRTSCRISLTYSTCHCSYFMRWCVCRSGCCKKEQAMRMTCRWFYGVSTEAEFLLLRHSERKLCACSRNCLKL